MNGTLIVLDGGEGTGKSSHAQHLEKLYGDRVVLTREPGGSPLAEKIRTLILSGDAKDANAETMFGLFWAARAAHFQETVIPAIADGKTVICDRLDSSSWAYQIRGQEQPQLIKLFWSMREHYLQGITPVYVILDVPVAVGLARAKSREGTPTHFDEREIVFHERVRIGLKEFAYLSKSPWYFVDAEASFEDVQARVVEIVSRFVE